MKKTQIPFRKVASFSEMFLDYIEGKEGLREFFEWEPKIESFKSAITKKRFSTKKREVLVEVLNRQYNELKCASILLENIQSLSESNTFTVTTGHQLNIFTGPVYFLFKLVSTINLSKNLKNIILIFILYLFIGWLRRIMILKKLVVSICLGISTSGLLNKPVR